MNESILMKSVGLKRPVAIDLFCGAGGMSLGFEQAGFDILFAIDYDPYHVATHKRNFPYGVAVCGSVSDLDARQITSSIRTSDIDLVFGGPPCQGFSHMGFRDKSDPRNTLVGEFVRLVIELQPKAFVMENVPGMQTGDAKPILDDAIERFRLAGYRITWPIKALNAKHYGVPQDRRRLFVLGTRQDIEKDIAYPPAITGVGYPMISENQCVTVWDAIADLPEVEKYEVLNENHSVEYDREPQSTYAQKARGTILDPSDFSNPRKWDGQICTASQRVRHSPEVEALYATVPVGSMVPGHKLPRLHPSGICPTLRAGSNSERGSHTAPRPVHPYKPRCITAREAARLHGFPDWFLFYPGKWHAYQQIGNAVCPPIAKAIGQEIMKTIQKKPIKSTKAIPLNEIFELPSSGQRSHQRLLHVNELSKVINWLFEKSLDPHVGILKKSSFSVSDIEKAISITQARLPRIRPEQFVSAIARSRNANEILGRIIETGFTVRSIGIGGEFVPKGTPGSVTDKDVVQIRSANLLNAKKVLIPKTPEVSSTLLNFFIESDLSTFLSDKVGNLKLIRSILTASERSLCVVQLGPKYGSADALVLATMGGNIPRRTQISSYIEKYGVSFAIIISMLTVSHAIFLLFEHSESTVRELTRETVMFEETLHINKNMSLAS